MGAFVIFLLDERKARARVLRERLSTGPGDWKDETKQDLTVVRDEMLSQIPVFDALLRFKQSKGAGPVTSMIRI